MKMPIFSARADNVDDDDLRSFDCSVQQMAQRRCRRHARRTDLGTDAIAVVVAARLMLLSLPCYRSVRAKHLRVVAEMHARLANLSRLCLLLHHQLHFRQRQ